MLVCSSALQRASFQFASQAMQIVAARRIESGESYIAGGAALNELACSPGISRDNDIFHDTVEAVHETFEADRRALERHGYTLRALLDRTTYVEAEISKEGESVLLQWTQDSAFRFFPLVEHDQFGLVLHPFDLATNKVLALIGRLEVRDWIDLISCHERIQRLGYLCWAACGKDPAFSPQDRTCGKVSAL